MIYDELAHILDFNKLDLALLSLTHTTELLHANLVQVQTDIESLATVQGDERKPLLILSNRLQAMSFFAQTISELAEHSIQLCIGAQNDEAIDLSVTFNTVKPTMLTGYSINPLIQSTISATLYEASSTASLVATALTHYAKELLKDSYNSSTIGGIKNTLATLLPAFAICYAAVTNNQHLGVYDE